MTLKYTCSTNLSSVLFIVIIVLINQSTSSKQSISIAPSSSNFINQPKHISYISSSKHMTLPSLQLNIENTSSMSKGLFESTLTLFISGFGDKSFFVGTIASMKYNKWISTFGSFSALIVMGAFSLFLGVQISSFVSPSTMDLISSMLFLLIGLNMLIDGYSSSADEYYLQEEVETPEQKDEEVFFDISSVSEDEKLKLKSQAKLQEEFENEGKIKNQHFYVTKTKPKDFTLPHNNSYTYQFIQVFMLVCIGEFGDRSQFSIIYFSNQASIITVAISVVLSNLLLSIISVLCGKVLATKFTIQQLTLLSGWLFMVFGSAALLYTGIHDFDLLNSLPSKGLLSA